MIAIYFRYSHFRISSTIEIKKLHKKCDEQAAALNNANERLIAESQNDMQKIQDLVNKINALHQEKENEFQLRVSAEKQLEISIDKVRILEAHLNDLKTTQEAAIQNSKEALAKVGNDLFKKLNDRESEVNKNLIGRVSQTVAGFFENFSKSNLNSNSNDDFDKFRIESMNNKNKSLEVVTDIVETMKANGLLANRNYFLPNNFDENKTKLMLCELAFVNKEILYIVDAKACDYFVEFEQMKSGDKTNAENQLKQKLERYFNYLNNPKYRVSIDKVISTTSAKFNKIIIVIALPSSLEMRILREVNFYDRAQKFGFEIMDINRINNIVL